MFNLFISCKQWLAIVWTGWIGLLIWAIGGFDLLVKSLLLLMLLDYITGMWVGFLTHSLNSKRAYKGISKKVMVIAILCCASTMSRLLPDLGIRNVVGIFYCATEILSIIENASKIGVPVPQKLKKALEQCQDGSCDKGCNINKHK